MSKKTLGVDSEQEQWAFDEWDDEKLKEVVSTQATVVKEQKRQKAGKELYGIAIVVDDFADDPRVMASRSAAAGEYAQHHAGQGPAHADQHLHVCPEDEARW